MIFFKRRSQTNILQMSQNPTSHHAEGYLTGQLLVSTPLLTDSIFKQSVILLFAHSAEGATGVIINHPMEIAHYDTLLDAKTNIDNAVNEELTLYCGGPVDRTRGFVVHSDEYDNGEILYKGDKVCVSANNNILSDMVQDTGPSHSLLAVGYAGWEAGQLEKEIEENSWITVPASPELVFHPDDEMKWAMASQSLGFDMSCYSSVVGHA